MNDPQDIFKAESLLGGDSEIFRQMENLRKDLLYPTADDKRSFSDHFAVLQKAIDDIPKLVLDTDVVPGGESYYALELAQTMEQIVDTSDRVLRKLNHFQGRLRDAERRVNNLEAEFIARYLLVALPLVKEIKMPVKDVRALAVTEFSRVIDNLDVRIIAMLEDLKVEYSRVASHKAAQKEKHELGRDQINISWTSGLPAYGGAVSGETSSLTQPQDEEEDVPRFISQTQSAVNAVKPGETIIIRHVEKAASPAVKEIVGNFKKTFTAAATPVKDESGTPVVITRRRFLDEEGEL